MSNRCRCSKVSKIVLKMVVGLVLASLPSYAQKKDPYSAEYRPAPAKSRAEQEAEQRVALSADKIIDLLRQEPGLLLEGKRVPEVTYFSPRRWDQAQLAPRPAGLPMSEQPARYARLSRPAGSERLEEAKCSHHHPGAIQLPFPGWERASGSRMKTSLSVHC